MVSKSVVASTLQANYKETHVDRWIWWWASCMRNMLIDAPARPSAAAHTRRYLKFIALRDALKVIVLHSWGFIGRVCERERDRDWELSGTNVAASLGNCNKDEANSNGIVQWECCNCYGNRNESGRQLASWPVVQLGHLASWFVGN